MTDFVAATSFTEWPFPVPAPLVYQDVRSPTHPRRRRPPHPTAPPPLLRPVCGLTPWRCPPQALQWFCLMITLLVFPWLNWSEDPVRTED
eukprot:COSAG04_NODE_3691_length_2602_cov_1.890132_2_plen_90_part_00